MVRCWVIEESGKRGGRGEFISELGPTPYQIGESTLGKVAILWCQSVGPVGGKRLETGKFLAIWQSRT